MSEIIVKEKNSSIEVSENAKHQFSFKAKLYYNETETDFLEIIKAIENIYKELHKKFK